MLGDARMKTTNIDRMLDFDDAWNRRDWACLAKLVSEGIVAHVEGLGTLVGRNAFVRANRAFCLVCPDARMNTSPYLAMLSGADQRRTASICRLTGTHWGWAPQEGQPPRRIAQRFDVLSCAFTTWTGGHITEQFRITGRLPDPLYLPLRAAGLGDHA